MGHVHHLRIGGWKLLISHEAYTQEMLKAESNCQQSYVQR
jgi:hypothetical protein